MVDVFRGTEAIANGVLTRGQLRWNYRPIYRDVYLPKNVARTLNDNIYAAWLWSSRKGIIAGRAAAAVRGAKWVDDFTCIELIGRFSHPPPGIIVRRETISDADVVNVAGLPVINPVRPRSTSPGFSPVASRSLTSTHLPARRASPPSRSSRWLIVIEVHAVCDSAEVPCR